MRRNFGAASAGTYPHTSRATSHIQIRPTVRRLNIPFETRNRAKWRALIALPFVRSAHAEAGLHACTVLGGDVMRTIVNSPFCPWFVFRRQAHFLGPR